MKKLISRSLFIILPVLALGISAMAQDEDKTPAAVVWQSGGTSTIEANIPARLAPGSAAGVKLYRQESKVSKQIVNKDDVPDCSASPALGEICKIASADGMLQFRYRFASRPGSDAKYSLAYFITDAKRGDIGQIVKVSQMFDKGKPEVQSIYSTEKKKEFLTAISGRPNGEVKVTIQLASAYDSLSPEAKMYVADRIRELCGWLEPKTGEPTGVATVRVEPQTREIPGNDPIKYKVVAMRVEPVYARDTGGDHMIDIILVTDKHFPVGKYDLEVVFAADAPRELAGRFLNTQTGTSIKQADSVTAIADKTMGARDLKNNLDLAIAYTSSVDNVKVGSHTIRQRTSNGVVDLRFAPLLNYHRDADRTNFFTPIFIDAKVSTGKISQKSLALNRILIGTEYQRRWRPTGEDGSASNNVYVFAFRGINASDRDFKHAEIKANVEFRPWFYKLNYPLTAHYRHPYPDSVLIESNGPKRIPCCAFGYQIQPIVGVEVGRVYRNRPTNFAVERSSPDIRRLYAGIETTFNLTRYINLNLRDLFYVRGETPQNRTRNYFYGEVQAPLIISRGTTQCLFFSFERGDQPPFATPTVNALKFGYRITSNFFTISP